eukprot:3478944-Pleurochrysis_carterae.AAC.1
MLVGWRTPKKKPSWHSVTPAQASGQNSLASARVLVCVDGAGNIMNALSSSTCPRTDESLERCFAHAYECVLLVEEAVIHILDTELVVSSQAVAVAILLPFLHGRRVVRIVVKVGGQLGGTAMHRREVGDAVLRQLAPTRAVHGASDTQELVGGVMNVELVGVGEVVLFLFL